MARDSYSYLHFPMVAGIVLVALGLKKTLGDVGEPLKPVIADGPRRRVPPCTCSPTSPSGCATSDRSTAQRLVVAVAAAGRDPGRARTCRRWSRWRSSPPSTPLLIAYESTHFAIATGRDPPLASHSE